MTNRRGWQKGFHPRTTYRNTRGLTAHRVPADHQAISFVQQLCSNPSESPEMLRKESTQKYGYLREFCKL
jgi:2-keto-3-deoxy-galactonokinase